MPQWLWRVATPLILSEWSRELADHPDPAFQSYLLNGISNGFHIGFDRRVCCTSATSNMHSALANAAVNMEYLKKEVTLGRVIGPVSPALVPGGTHLSPLGVIPSPTSQEGGT